MKLNLKLSVAALCASLSLSAQQYINGRGCGTHLPPAGWDNWFNSKVDEHTKNLSAHKVAAAQYNIPVVVHVIHGGQAIGTFPNLSVAQINSQISVLNADFAGNGYNVANLANTQFASIGAADCDISFCMAQFDPDGNLLDVPGIDRVDYTNIGPGTNPNSLSSQNSFQNYIDNTVKPATIWDPTRYFNIWITDVGQGVGLLGYATFPPASGLNGLSGSTGNNQDDGIWVYAKAFGNVGNGLTLQSPYNKGRTATHETGHYLGLRHIGGDGQANGTGGSNPNGDCSATDYCNDTPPQRGGFGGGSNGQNFGAPTYNQPLHANICTSTGDMFMNFMDYTNDASNYMFTPDQATRFHTALENSPFRNQLTASASTLCASPQSMPVAEFSIATDGCKDSPMTVNNETTGDTPTYSWSAVPATGVVFNPNATSATPSIQFASSGTYSIMMVASNSAGSNTAVNKVEVTACTTGINSKGSVLSQNISLSPNPSSGLVNITTTLSGNQTLEVFVHNALGQQVFIAKYTNVSANTYSIDLEKYPVGVYSVTITNGAEKTVKRMVLNK